MKALRPYQRKDAALQLTYSDTITTPGGQLIASFQYGKIARRDFWKAESVAMNGEGKGRKDALAKLWAAIFPAYPLPVTTSERDAQLEQFSRYYKAKVFPFLRLCGKAHALQRHAIPLYDSTHRRIAAAKARAQYFLYYHLAKRFGGRATDVSEEE